MFTPSCRIKVTHLGTLQNTFEGYFETDHLNLNAWVKCLFSFDQMSDQDLAKDELLDLHQNQKLRTDFESMELNQFGCQIGELFPILTKRVHQVLVP